MTWYLIYYSLKIIWTFLKIFLNVKYENYAIKSLHLGNKKQHFLDTLELKKINKYILGQFK